MNLTSLFTLRPDWIIRLLLAAVTGAVIGLERQTRSKEAGMGTHAIVCIAACAITIVSKYGFDDVAKVDAARLAAQIISGISFLGAGIIFVRNESIQGLTTAAGVFTTAGIGIAYGSGLCGVGLFTGFLVVLVQYFLHHVRHGNGQILFETVLGVTTKENETDIEDIMAVIRKYCRRPAKIMISEKDNRRLLETDLITSHESNIETVIKELKQLPIVAEVTLHKK